ADFTARRIVAKASQEAIQARVISAAKRGMAPAELLEMAREASRAEADAAEPVERRLTTQDPTVEALGELLRDNPNIGVIRDELTGLLRSMEKPDRGADRAFYLEAWDGNRTTFQYDRIGRGKITIKNPTVSILGSIQPGPLRGLLREVARGESGDD